MTLKINKIQLLLIAILCMFITLTVAFLTTINTNLKSSAQIPVDTSFQIASIELNNDLYKNAKTFNEKEKTYAILLNEEVMISCVNADESEIIVTCDKTSDLIYNIEYNVPECADIFLTINIAGEFKITLIQNNTYDYITLTVYESINNITIACNQTHPMEYDEIYFYLIFNNNIDLGIPNYTSQWKTTNKKNNVLEFPNASGDTPLHLDATNNYLYLFDNTISGEWSNFNIECEATINNEKLKANATFQLNQYTLASTIKATSENIILLNNDTNAYIEVYITKNAKPLFSIFDATNSIKLVDFNKISSDLEDFDKYELNVFATTSLQHEILLLLNANNIEVTSYLSLAIKATVYEKINTIAIKANKSSYKPNEKITVSATINNGTQINTKITWHVNNNIFTGENYDFTFTKKKGGSYLVKAQVGDVISEEALVEVSYTKTEMYFWYSLLLLSIITAFIYKFYVKKQLIKYNKKLSDLVEMLQLQFKQYEAQPEKLFKKSNYAKLISIREKAWFEFDAKQESYIQNAYQQLKSASFIIKKNLSHKNVDATKIEKSYNQAMKHIDNALKHIQTYDALKKTITN